MRKNEVVIFICAKSLSGIQVGERERNDTNLRMKVVDYNREASLKGNAQYS
jgi:hypothetical protein